LWARRTAADQGRCPRCVGWLPDTSVVGRTLRN
jgi:hypothetical protein